MRIFSCCAEYSTEVWVSPLWIIALQNVFQEHNKKQTALYCNSNEVHLCLVFKL